MHDHGRCDAKPERPVRPISACAESSGVDGGRQGAGTGRRRRRRRQDRDEARDTEQEGAHERRGGDDVSEGMENEQANEATDG